MREKAANHPRVLTFWHSIARFDASLSRATVPLPRDTRYRHPGARARGPRRAPGGAGAPVAVVASCAARRPEPAVPAPRPPDARPACTTANGCFRKANQNGGAQPPAADASWAGEISLDLDMVS